ncbi:MAG TPA: YciI family protein [Polyangiaceae bacterium]|nr:YciI family protein [Polyangiaceae bacterium]
MTEYLFLTLEDESAHASETPQAMARLIEQRAEFGAELRRGGRLRDAGRFRPSKEGKRVARRDERLDVRDGPFSEDGKTLGGYYWVEASGVTEAARLAEACPALAPDAIEVRPLMDGRVSSEKEAKPGKIFACAVLGSGATEAAWVGVMDRIDAETRGRFPEASFLGGLRLEAPKSGRRLETRSERRVTFDGPFLECKEVIGGLFFLRMTTLDEAVRWAAETPFVVHGVLEIRELWRI